MERRGFQGTSTLQDLIILRSNYRSAQGDRYQAIRHVTRLNLLIFVTARATFRAINLVNIRIKCQACFRPALLYFKVGLRIVACNYHRARIATARARSTMKRFRLLRRSFRVGRRLLVQLFKILKLIGARSFRFKRLVRTIRSTRILTMQANFTTRTLHMNAILSKRFFFVSSSVAVSINRKGLYHEGRVRIIRNTIMRLSFFIKRLSYTMTKDFIRSYKQRSFLMTQLTYFVRRRISRNTLRANAFTAMCKRTHANGLPPRIGVSRVVFLNRFRVKRNVLQRFNLRTTNLCSRIIFDANSFQCCIMKSVKSNT